MEKPKVLNLEHGFHSLVISIGFDGVCVTDDFPKIGRDIGAAPVLRKLTDTGHKLILNTVRKDIKHLVPRKGGIKQMDRFYLSHALHWFEENNIPLYGVNKNPLQGSWSDYRKVNADLYIDDKALGIPLISPFDEKPYVEWKSVDRWLERGCYFWNGVW